MSAAAARETLANALAVADAYHEQYQHARQRYTAAPAGTARSTAHTLLRHAGDQLRAARLDAEKAAAEVSRLENAGRQSELAL